MIESGSHVPGIDPANFGLPPGTALRYERPADPLRRFFPAYAVMDSIPEQWTDATTWVLPGWSRIWVLLTAKPIKATLRNRSYAPLGNAILYGSTSRAIPVTASGGITVAIDLSPVGWARWFDVPAKHCRDRIVPLEQLWPAERVIELIARLHASDRGPQVKGVLDDFLTAHLPPPNPNEARIEAAMQVLADPDVTEASEAAAALNISPQALLRLAHRYIGHSPKLLMRRTRFLRPLTAMLIAGQEGDAVPIGYYDAPHFLRDADQFLGVTPLRFLAMPMPYLRAVLRAREAVIGAALSLLDFGVGWRHLGNTR